MADTDTPTHSRKRMGEHFSEGSRLLWEALDEREWSQRKLGRELGAHEGEIMKLLYGDKLPRIELVVAADRLLGINADAWITKPTRSFVPPAARRLKGAA